MNNFVQRVLTGIVFVSVLVGSIIYSPLSVAILFGFFTFFGTKEYINMAERTGNSPHKSLAIITSLVVYTTLAFTNINLVPSYLWVVIVPVAILVFIHQLFKDSQQPFNNIAHTLFPTLYVALPFVCVNLLLTSYGTSAAPQYELLLAFFILMWTSDTGAYLSGRTFGKTKLFERISPKKTWEGTIGGAILAIGVAYLLSLSFSIEFWLLGTMALLIVVFGNFGDLAESMLKRKADIKDSGNILPGHGGILDRFDAVLFAAPIIYCLIYVLSFVS